MRRNQYYGFCAIFGLLCVNYGQSIQAQIIPDSTLSSPSIVTSNGNTLTIEGGTIAGSNLFHSFSEFSLTNGTAFFNNVLEIDNIITRITGNNLSNIDGLIRANGNANLFLINSNGINFGANANLEIGGSFVASTAENLLFSDGFEFSATNPQESPLLTITTPIGLQLGANSGDIKVQGNGHALTLINVAPPEIIGAGNSSSGLRFDSGKAVALIGRNIILDGGIITVPSGKIELGAVQEGLVNLTEGLTFKYENIDNFGEINFINRALADSSGNSGGSIQIQGDNIQLQGGSALLIQNQGTEAAGELRVNATSVLKLSGIASDETFATRITNATVSEGNGGNIVITTGQLIVEQGAGILVQTFGSGQGGNLDINASELIEVDGVSPLNAALFSAIATFTTTDANSGNVTLVAPHIRLFEGSSLGSTTFGTGMGGDLIVDAIQVEIEGFDLNFFLPTVLAASTLGSGNAGTVLINAEQLILRESGSITSSTANRGNAGSIIINASDFVEVSGTVPEFNNPAGILSNGNILDEATRQLFELPDFPTGDAGSIILNTPQLRISEGTVGVSNDGVGDGGIISINADAITLDRQGQITASTISGEGGNLNLNIQNILLLRNGSTVTTTAGGSGNGGNITIDSDIITLLEDSTIVAQAFEGAGGNIQLSTQGLFISPDSEINASSQFGVDGIISVTNPEVDTGFGILELPTDVVNSSQQVAVGCAAFVGNSFTITGRGGIPNNPTTVIRGQNVWQDWSDYTEYVDFQEGSSSVSLLVQNVPIVEANSWIVNKKGHVELVTLMSDAPVERNNFLNCISRQLKK